MNAKATSLTPSITWDIRLMNIASAVLLAFFIWLLLSTFVAWAWNHPAFPVRSIVVQGDMKHQSEQMVRDALVMGASGSFMSVNLNEMAQRVQTLPWVRHAEVHRDFPYRLRVVVQEHQPIAWWGAAGSSDMLNRYGEVFSAPLNEKEKANWPVIKGPPSRSAEMYAAWKQLQVELQALAPPIEMLMINERGDWSVQLAQGVRIELGKGSMQEWMPLLQKALHHLPEVTSRYGADLLSMDLRYPNGFAVQLKGVVTTGTPISFQPPSTTEKQHGQRI